MLSRATRASAALHAHHGPTPNTQATTTSVRRTTRSNTTDQPCDTPRADSKLWTKTCQAATWVVDHTGESEVSARSSRLT